jgi:hypothetical protein
MRSTTTSDSKVLSCHIVPKGTKYRVGSGLMSSLLSLVGLCGHGYGEACIVHFKGWFGHVANLPPRPVKISPPRLAALELEDSEP